MIGDDVWSYRPQQILTTKKQTIKIKPTPIKPPHKNINGFDTVLHKEHISAKACRLYVSLWTFTLLQDHAYPIYCSSGATRIRQRLTLPHSRKQRLNTKSARP